jgi:hypothetical protein
VVDKLGGAALLMLINFYNKARFLKNPFAGNLPGANTEKLHGHISGYLLVAALVVRLYVYTTIPLHSPGENRRRRFASAVFGTGL